MRPEVILALLMLAFFALQDLFRSSISVVWAVLFAIPALALAWFRPHGDLLSLFTALLPGIAILLLSRVTRGGIGSGDGIVLLLMGLCLSFYEVLFSLLAGLSLSFLYSVWLLASGRGKARTAFPFLPFLLPGTLLFLYCSHSF